MKNTKTTIFLCVMLFASLIFYGCHEKQKDIQNYFYDAETAYSSLMSYSENIIQVYNLSVENEQTITFKNFRIHVNLSEKQIEEAISDIIGAKEVKKLPDYSSSKVLFDYYHINDIQSYYFWVHEKDSTDACLAIIRQAYKKGKTLEKAQKKIKEVAGSLENLTDKEQFAIEQYLNSLRELLAYCKEPTDAESGMQLKEQAKNYKFVVAEIAKEKYIANYAK